MNSNNNLLEKDEDKSLQKTDMVNTLPKEFKPLESSPTDRLSIFTLCIAIFISIILLAFIIFTVYNMFNTYNCWNNSNFNTWNISF